MKDKVFTSDEIKQRTQNKMKVEPFETYEPEWITLDQVKSRNQPWFWPGMIPLETLTLFAGYGGIGKSIVLLHLISKTTTGNKFNAGGVEHQLPQGSVILLSAEDDTETQIKPKLVVENANTSKVHFVKSKIGKISGKKKFLELDVDLHHIEQRIKEVGDVKLIIIDPVTYFLGSVRDNYNSEVANFLQNLIDLSKDHKIATILNKHLRKAPTGAKGAADAANEVAGAGAWINTPRRNWLVSNWHEDNDVKILSNLKDNLGKRTEECLAYRIEGTTIEDDGDKIETTKIVWLNEMIKISADEAVNEEHYQKTKLEQAIDFIHKYLKENGKSRLQAIEEAAAREGFKDRTFRRAKTEFETIYKDNLSISKGVRGAKMYELEQ
jgi:putative DNA primase/helicase